MIYKIFYQETKERNPQREQTHSLYVDVDNDVTARRIVEENTPYNIEYIQELTGNHLEYEKEHTDFHITEF
ncbi:DNA-dependent RNA polymerase auxiliary subunit epsilon family protein [Tetragenococcus koreensis]|uniref:DNA-directed RNA polymerase subunit epsilon n=1 Tax=Tetragenococcus koreensis TaxID=290335 RepID=A0AAN4ZQ80_9ENTE|nr:DNA-directed RNA polymerase subunit epsilon [Tetragenococcus koreensis]AYW45593.1 hypothetical protein C7K43_06330 [Tetragenococcus koreensis]MCF1585281.1 DNA-dependent RNA polymerase auxiliary subunit epsilon family protein [Tetragenococcus koreensis]MCF1614208.1 DNA-dependent RNA polymerase auxiliary subunit epsilon family protein [Tetragenococcus koreensis]MCF1617689.1 DNA-dependent RNA polymerase auxiliary subunit epsilon family protein [Tetragenococcus koreensis]MCF1619597.1 DNA-depend